MWSYVPFNMQMYGDSQVSAEVWRDTLLGWTFTTTGSWSSGGTETLMMEFSSPSDLQVEEFRSTDEACLSTLETYTANFYVRHTFAFQQGLEIRGRSTAVWVGNFDGWLLQVLHTPPVEGRIDPELVLEGPTCPCDYRGEFSFSLGPSSIDSSSLRPVPIRGQILVRDQTGEREFLFDHEVAELSPR